MSKSFKVLAIGDIIGRPGRDILATKLQAIIDSNRIDFVIANGENAAGGSSIISEIFHDFMELGINVITTGNHVWDNDDVYSIIDREDRLLRPANYPPGLPGKGYFISSIKGVKICVINLMGRSQMQPIDCPFRAFDAIYDEFKDKIDVFIVDFHAETTSEKRAFGWYVDGRASFVYGTHTHVQTADEEILTNGTAYITDIGMTGAFDSVIGVEKHKIIQRFLYGAKVKYDVAVGNPKVNGVICFFNESKKAEKILRINE